MKTTKKPRITHITLSKDIKLSRDYNGAGVFVSMTASVEDGTLDDAKKLLRKEVDSFIAKRLAENSLFLKKLTSGS